MQKFIKILLILSLFLIVGYFSLEKISSTKINKNNKLQNITIAQWGQEKYLIYLPFYIAQERGFFKDEKLQVNIKYSGNDDQVFATVLNGEAKFGIGDPIFTAIAREKGAKGKVIASIVNGVALWGISKKENNISQVLNVEDLSNLRIGTFPKPSTTYTLIKNTIAENKNILKNTTIVEASFGTQIALLESNNSDIAMELEPGASIAESQGYEIVYSLPEFYGDFSFTGLTTLEDTIKNETLLVQKVVNAIEKSCVFAHSNHEETIKIAQKLFPKQDANIIKKAVLRMINANTLPPHAFTSIKGWEKAIDIRVQVGDLKSSKNSTLSLDNSFALKAKEEIWKID